MEPLHAKGRNGQIAFDGRTVSITREGFVARSTHGRSEKTLPLANIAAVQFKPATALVMGYIQFSIAGESAKKSRHTQDTAKDENAVIFAKAALPEFDAIRNAIYAAQNAEAEPHAPDITDQISRLAQLRDGGAITNDEYEAKKAELLSRI